jgi:ubiquinone/menaquinone biosynthesis C-methylase UbiE
VDFVVCRAAFKNFTEPLKALREMRRVRMNRWVMLFVSRHMLIKRAHPLEQFRRMAIEAGWDQLQIDASPMGFEAWFTR